jgi:non-specific serine/threonine protein kinase
VDLAAVRDPGGLAPAIAAVLEVKETAGQPSMAALRAHLRPRQMLLLLDNFEQIVAAAPLVSELLAAAPRLKILVTSRIPLHVLGEHQYDLAPFGFADVLPDGVRFVSLAAEAQEPAVLAAISRALRAPEQAGQALLESLVRYLADKRLLLVLKWPDGSPNASQAVESLLRQLPERASGVRLLVTDGQAAWVPAHSTPGADLTTNPALRLFLDRAQAGNPGFTVTEQALLISTAICARLDGLPLALELAAARSRTFPLPVLLARLEQRLATLVGGARNLPTRQQSLQALLDWSWDLLDPVQQRLFAGCAVFARGWTAEAAAAVCADPVAPAPPEAMYESLMSLAEQGLLQVHPAPAGLPRFSLLETMREYAADRLSETGEAALMRARHCTYFLALAEESEPQIRIHYDSGWMERIEAEHDNMRLALEWTRADPAGAETELRLAGALQPFWHLHGYWSEGIACLEAALARAGNRFPAARAKALTGAGRIVAGQGDFPKARGLLEAGAALFRAVGDTFNTARTLVTMSWVVQRQGDLTRAEAALQEALTLYRELDSKAGIGDVLENLGIIALNQGDFQKAQAFSEESMELNSTIGNGRGLASSALNLGEALRAQQNWGRAAEVIEQALAIYRQNSHKAGIALAEHNLGQIRLAQGDSVAAGDLFTDSIALYLQLDNREGIAMCLAGLVAVAVHNRQWDRAARLTGATDGLLRHLKTHLDPPDALVYTEHLAQARQVLSREDWASAWAAGASLSLEEAVALGLALTG